MKKHTKNKPDPFPQSAKEARKDAESRNEIKEFVTALLSAYK